jgi:glycosyltransferase involved in cell wall biosynthesis
MRVAIVTPVFPPYRGGIGTVAADDARRLRERGVEVTVFTPDYHRGYRQEEGVRRLAGVYTWGNASLLPQLFWQLRGFDVIHLHYTFYGGEIFTILAAKLWRIPLVMTYHMQPKASGWLGKIFTFHRKTIEPLVLRAARQILVSSLDYATSIGLKGGKLVDMPFCVDTERFSPARDDAFRLRFGIPSRDVVLLFVGGLDAAHYFKGLPVLLEACTRLPKEIPWRLLVVGDGDRRSTYEAQARHMGLIDRVVFAGSVPYEDLPRAYRAADMHILPSIDRSEAFGLVTLEASASGLPSIVSNLPGVRTLVDDGQTGYLVEPSNVADLSQRITWLLEHDEKRRAWGETARRRAEANYGTEHCTERLLDVYKRISS